MILSILMFIPAFVTATLTAFVCGILLKFGLVNLWMVLVAIVIGDAVSNIFWYMAGRVGGKIFLATFGRLFGINQGDIESSVGVFNKYKDYVAFFTSAFVGMGIMILGLMSAGLRRFAFWRYIVLNTLVGMVWVAAMLALGYGLGQAYVVFGSVGGRVLTSLGLLVVLFLLLTLGAWVKTILVRAVGGDVHAQP